MPNSYIDIPISNEYIFFDLIDHESGIPLINPSFPIGIGMNFETLYDLGCRIRIHELLSNYNLTLSDIADATLYLNGTNSVGDMDVYSTSGVINDSPITPNGFDYIIPLDDTYDNTFCGYLFKMVTLNADRYSTFTNTNSYIRIEYNALESIYIYTKPKTRYFVGEELDLSNIVIKATYTNGTESTIQNYISSMQDGTVLSISNTSIIFSHTINLRTRTTTLTIEVFPWGELNTNYINGGTNSQQSFDIYGPSITNNNQTFPVVITIHGGDFTGGDKNNYNYITPFIINNGCIHVNINYRLMSISIENDIYTNTNGIHYQDMLSDINTLINYLYNNSSVYHINTSKIALMGYSAGGNLAFNYTMRSYLSLGEDAVQSAIPIKLIITQGAPFFIELTKENNDLAIESDDPHPYINNPANITKIKNEIKMLIGFGTEFEIELNKINPLSFLENGQSFPINLFIQGTGFNNYGYEAQECQVQSIEYQGDGIVSEKGINALIEQRGQANDIHKAIISFCSHSNYNAMTLTDSHCLSALEDAVDNFVNLSC